MSYTIQRTVDDEFDTVVEQTIDALDERGFGILCDIDVQATMRKKLDADFRQYRILGACNPPLAKEALDAETELGALLPCNVIVYETDEGQVGVSAVDPGTMLSIVENPQLDDVAAEVTELMTAALDQVAAT